MFNLNTALIQTARDKAVEILKSFQKNGKEDSVLRLRRISIRFDRRCYSFSKTTNVLTPYWLSLKLNHGRRTSFPIVFGGRQRQLIEDAFQGKLKFTTVEMVKRKGEWYAHFTLKKTVFFKEPETVIGIDIGENNLTVAVALKDKPRKARSHSSWRHRSDGYYASNIKQTLPF